MFKARIMYATAFVLLLSLALSGIYLTVSKAPFSDEEEFVNLYVTVFCDDGELPAVRLEIGEAEDHLNVWIEPESGDLLRCQGMDVSGPESLEMPKVLGRARVVTDEEFPGGRCFERDGRKLCEVDLIAEDDHVEVDVRIEPEPEAVSWITADIYGILQTPSLSNRRLSVRLSTHQYPSNSVWSVATYLDLSAKHSVQRMVPVADEVFVGERGITYVWNPLSRSNKHRRVTELLLVNERLKPLEALISLFSVSLLGALFGSLLAKMYSAMLNGGTTKAIEEKSALASERDH